MQAAQYTRCTYLFTTLSPMSDSTLGVVLTNSSTSKLNLAKSTVARNRDTALMGVAALGTWLPKLALVLARTYSCGTMDVALRRTCRLVIEATPCRQTHARLGQRNVSAARRP